MDVLRSALVLCVLMAAIMETLATVSQQDTEGCVRKCKRSMKNKKYQSCNGCNEYVVCMAKKQLMHMPCAADNEWDDVEKECVAAGTSTTCDTGYVAVTIGEPTHPPDHVAPTNAPGAGTGSVEPGDCLESCDGMQNGYYQSCTNCSVFAQCVEGLIYDDQDCPETLVWDDHIKQCNYTSTTCPIVKDYTGPIGGTGVQADTEENGSTNDCTLMEETLVNITVDGCMTVGDVKRTSCVGKCGMTKTTYQVDNRHTTDCKCCHVLKSEPVEVELNCPPERNDYMYTYNVITQCGSCGPCPKSV